MNFYGTVKVRKEHLQNCLQLDFRYHRKTENRKSAVFYGKFRKQNFNGAVLTN